MERVIELHVSQAGQRIDKYIAVEVSDLSRSLVQKLIEEGLVTVNGAVTKASYRIGTGDDILIRVPPPKEVELVAEPIPLDIVYEDQDVIVVNKPAGMVVHPAYGHRSGTLVNAVLAHCPELAGLNGTQRPGIVHRLDKDTSGLIVVAKNKATKQSLQRQFKRREVEKLYLVLVERRLEPERGIIEAPIGRDPKRRKRMAVVSGGREARTEYQVLERFPRHTLVEVKPKTGRTHQVRVHFSSIGHPVAGDRIYGFRKQRLELKRQFLHAQTLGFKLPSSGRYVEFTAELPGDLKEVLEGLKASHI